MRRQEQLSLIGVMDRTYLYRELARQKLEDSKEFGEGIFEKPQRPEDKLTKECEDINSKISTLNKYLGKIRPLYLSNTRATSFNNSLTEKQRDEIDYETRMIIQTQAGRIRQLEALETGRMAKQEAQSAFSKLLKDPKQEGSSKTIGLHRVGMFWYLNNELKSVSDLHASQQEIRLSRKLEKAKSDIRAPVISNLPPSIQDEFRPNNDSIKAGSLSAEQIQELELESSALLEELELTHDKVKNAQKSMQEISELQTSLAVHLSTQSNKIQSLLDDAFQTQIDISAANQQLSSAKTRNRRASKMIIWASVIIALILLINDAMLG